VQRNARKQLNNEGISMLRKAVGLISVAVLCACSPANRADSVAARNVIDSLNTRFEAWYAGGHADSIAAVFAQDARQMPPNMAPVVGRDSVRAFWTNALRTGKWDFDLEAEDVVAADSVAVERGRYTLKVVAGPQAQYPSFEDRGNYMVLWRRESDGNWRVVWDAAVSTVAMPMPPKPPATPPKKT
jgi:ketosteroid isomerase-like protein